MKKELKRYFRNSCNWQADLARELGVDRSLISHWLAGRRKPGRSKLISLSKITGIPIEDLLR